MQIFLKIFLFLVFVVLTVVFGGMVRGWYPELPTIRILWYYWWIPLVAAGVLELLYKHLDLPDDSL